MKRILAILILMASLPAYAQQMADVFVSTTGNDSTGTGTLAAPYATLAKGQSAIDAIMAGGSGCGHGRTSPFVVMLRGGTYQLPVGTASQATFTSSDNGCSATQPVVYTSYPGENAIVDGGLTISGWADAGSACSGACEKYTVTLSGSAAYFENLYYQQTYPISTLSCSVGTATVKTTLATQLYTGTPVQIVSNPSFNGFGTAGTVSTTTNTNDTFTFAVQGGTCPAANANVGSVVFSSRRQRPRWYSSNSHTAVGYTYPMTQITFSSSPPANCLDNGSGTDVCIDRVGYTSTDLTSLPTTNIHSSYSGSTAGGASSCTAIGGNNYPDGEVEVILFDNNQTPKMRLYCVDGTGHILYFMSPVYVSSTSYVAQWVPITGHRYILENIKYTDANAIPQTWYLDRSASPWTLTYYAITGENPNTDTVIIPQMAPVVSATGLQYASFQGLTFAHDNWQTGTNGYPDTHSGFIFSYNGGTGVYTNTGQTALFSCVNCSNVTFLNNIFMQSSGSGLDLYTGTTSQTTHANIIKGNAFVDIGGHGIRLGMYNESGCSSGCPGNTDTDANIASSNYADNNLIDGVGRVIPSSSAILAGDIRNNLFANNDLFDSYHGGISVCELNCTSGPAGATWHGAQFNVFRLNHAQYRTGADQ